MPTKCFTKANKQGEPYTACVDTKTFKKKGVKGNAKSRKPSAKGINAIQKKIKTTRKLKNKSTFKIPLAKSKPKPKPKASKKLSAGKAVLLTQRGFMEGVGAYVGSNRNIVNRRIRAADRRAAVRKKEMLDEADRVANEFKKERAIRRREYLDERNRNIKDGQKLLADLKKSKSAPRSGGTPKERQRVIEWLADRKKVNKLYKSLKIGQIRFVKDPKGVKMRTLLGKALQKQIAYV